jgi:hypothetical protein
MRRKYQSGNDSLPLRSTISLGGDCVPVPMKEMDVADRTICRLAAIYEHVALRDGVGEDYVLGEFYGVGKSLMRLTTEDQ